MAGPDALPPSVERTSSAGGLQGPRVYRPIAFLQIRARLRDSESLDSEAASQADPFDQNLKVIQKKRVQLRNRLALEQALQSSSNGLSSAADIIDVNDQLRGLDREEAALRSGQKQQQSGTDTTKVQTSNDLSVDFYVVPTELNVELNSFRIADECQGAFPFKDLPLPADAVRSFYVRAFMGSVGPTEFSDPLQWRFLGTLLNPNGNNTQPMFSGYIDQWEDQHDENGSFVQFRARSVDAILMDAKVFAASAAPLIHGGKEPIDVFVKKFLQKIPQVSGALGPASLDVRFEPSLAAAIMAGTAKVPTLERTVLSKALQTAKSRNKANGSVDGQLPNVETAQPDASTDQTGQQEGSGTPRLAAPTLQPDTNAWDIIVTACEKVGLIPIWDPLIAEDAIILAPPQNLFQRPDGGVGISFSQDGFHRAIGDKAGQIIETDVRFMVWGHNLKTFKRSKKYGKIAAPGVQVISYNQSADTKHAVLTALYPDRSRGDKASVAAKARGKNVKSGGKVSTYVTRVVHGVRDIEQLRQIAMGLYNSIARQETSIHLETDDMASFVDPSQGPGTNENDLLTLRAGMAIRIMIALKQLDPSLGLTVTPLSDFMDSRGVAVRQALTTQYGKYLVGQSGQTPASLIERAMDKVTTALNTTKVPDTFYVRTVSHKWNAEDGWSCEMELVNFNEVYLPENLSAEDKALDESRRATKRLVESLFAKRNPERILDPLKSLLPVGRR